MKVLLICDYIDEIGGVANYTRPLFYEMNKTDVDVTYLYTSSQRHHYTFRQRPGIVKVSDSMYEYVNCPILVGNYDRLQDDISCPEVEEELERFLVQNRFDVVHIHSILGYPASIYKVIRAHTDKLLTTVHEYWWLCPYRVMVDFNNRICEGPRDLNKCSFCIAQRPRSRDKKEQIFVYKMSNDFPRITRLCVNIKGLLRKNKRTRTPLEENLSFGDKVVPEKYDSIRYELLEERLKASIDGLNLCDTVIAVSSDTKRILAEYGVDQDRILVQHIGSVIAEEIIEHTKPIDPDKVSIGFIGGVGYYKGVHQLVDAFVRLPEEIKSKSVLNIFGGYSPQYYNAIQHQIIKDDEDRNRIVFHGRFSRAEIPGITNKIDFSVLPSLCADTAPQTIFESFNAGLPIIAPRVGGFSDFVVDGKNGLLYEAASVEDLSDKLRIVLQDPGLIPEMRKHIVKTKTMKENVEELLEIYCR